MGAVKQVIYISGSGRSGSTLLERILHSAPGACSVGELHCLWRLPADAITCSCGAPFAADDRWRRIVAEAGFDRATLEELPALEGTVCRSGFIARHRFSLDSLRADPQVQRFLALQFRLFDAIARVSGSSLVVDSSKAGPRAWLLACDPRVAVLHLHRDPADVIVSWRSVKFDPGLGTAMQRIPVRAAALDWWKADRFAALLARVHPVARVDYQELCRAPRAALAAALATLGVTLPGEPQWLGPDAVEPGDNYHSLNGNPDRFDNGPLRIAARRVDWSRIAAAERPLIRLAAGALRVLSPRKSFGQAVR
ncbi:MAG: sulfotransferase [Sphingomonadales bacterium]|nr:sulfotransferase [Sphingomonadales bacterium]MBU3993260.1 sulfotransferase [Alphaproteobacteria bacterium]